MTCIVGLVVGEHVTIGGDSAGTDGWFGQTIRRDRKVFRSGKFVFGFTSSFRMGQLLAFDFHPPAPRADTDLMAYMVTDFIDAVRTRLKTGGFARVKDQVEGGGTFLVGYCGRLFHIADDFQVGESAHGFDACGSGADLALGALNATRGSTDHGWRIEEALSAAEAFNAAVRRPFHVISTAEPAYSPANR